MKAMLKISWPKDSPAMSRHDREQDRGRAAKADPRDEGALAAREAERQEAEPDGDRPRQEGEEYGDAERRHHHARKLRRRREQAEGQEHGDLAQPGGPLLEALQRHRMADAGVPGDQPGDEHREEAAPLEHAGGGEYPEGQRQHHDRVERALEVGAVHDLGDDDAADDADQPADGGLECEVDEEVDHGPFARRDSELHQRDGEEDGDRVVRSRLHFERRADAVADVDAADPEQEEHRGRVGRRHHRAEDQPVHPRQAEDQVGRDRDQPCRQDDAERREHARRPRRDPKRRGPRREARIEEDDRERHAADEERRPAIVELDAERAILAGEQPDGQEDEEERRAEAEADEAGEHRRDDKRRADEYRHIHRFEHEVAPPQVMRTARSALPLRQLCLRSVADQWLGPRIGEKESSEPLRRSPAPHISGGGRRHLGSGRPGDRPLPATAPPPA